MWERGSGEIFCLDSSIYLLEKNIHANALTFVNVFYYSVRLLAFVSIRRLEQSFAWFFVFEACQNIFWVTDSHFMHDKIFLSLSPNQMKKLNYFSQKKWWKRNEISPLGVKSGLNSIFMKTLKHDFLIFYSTETTIANVTKIFCQINEYFQPLPCFTYLWNHDEVAMSCRNSSCSIHSLAGRYVSLDLHSFHFLCGFALPWIWHFLVPSSIPVFPQSARLDVLTYGLSSAPIIFSWFLLNMVTA